MGALVYTARGGPMSGVVVRAGDAQLVVGDQRDVVGTIKVDTVVSPGPGWLIVQADWGDGVPDAILGSLAVQPGGSSDVTIPISSQGQLPHRVFVTLLADGGQPKVLEYYVPNRPGMANMPGMGSTMGTGAPAGQAGAMDKVVIVDGMPVTAHITIEPLSAIVETGRASIASASVPATSTTVTLHGVRAPAKSWAVVSTEGTGGVPGAVLGKTAVPPGYFSTVSVELPSPVGHAKMSATLHVDLGTPGTFDYSPASASESADKPYVAGGQSVSVPVLVTR